MTAVVMMLAVTAVLVHAMPTPSMQTMPALPTGASPRSSRPTALVGLGAVAVGCAWPLVGFQLALYAVGAAVVGLTVRRLAASRKMRRRRRSHQEAVIELCDALAAELHAGVPTRPAVELACRSEPAWEQIATTARLEGDVSAAVRATARQPGARGLLAIAAAWDVSARSGAGLADVIDRIASGLRDDHEAMAEVTAALAPARATAKLLAVLPVFGLGLGVSMGAHPLDFLLGTGAGLACLTVGILLALTGVLWVERLADSAET